MLHMQTGELADDDDDGDGGGGAGLS